MMSDLTTAAINLLKDLIKIPSFPSKKIKPQGGLEIGLIIMGYLMKNLVIIYGQKIKTLIHQNQLFF